MKRSWPLFRSRLGGVFSVRAPLFFWWMRAVELDGEPWFMAADVCRCLGAYIKSDGCPNATMATNLLSRKEVRLNRIDLYGKRGLRTRKVLLISESGLYKLIMRSDKPAAKKFQDWVTWQPIP